MIVEVVILLGLLFCLAVAFILYKSKVDFVFKLITLPLAIIFSLAGIYAMVTLAGAPIRGFPVDKFDYIAHKVTNEGKEIVLWARPQEVKDYRLYTFPYDRKTEKKLNEAQQKGKKNRVQGKFKSKMMRGKKNQELQLFDSKPEYEGDNPVKPESRIP